MTEQVAEEAVETVEPEQETDATEEETVEEEPATFPRKVVEDLRRENATYRTRAPRADDLAARLHTSMVAATGRLADPSDLAFEESHLDDEYALSAAIATC